MENENFKKIKIQLEKINSRLVFVHSDIQGGFEIPPDRPFNRVKFLERHFAVIKNLLDPADIWFPAFNYGYSEKRIFNVYKDPSHVGHISEYVRTSISEWRTSVPVYSITGTGAEPKIEILKKIDPFGSDSIFQMLIDKDGIIFNYGCSLDKLTFIHYIEALFPGLSYRYQKEFNGIIIKDDRKFSVECSFHVRPAGIDLNYDWNKLKNELIENNILISITSEGQNYEIIGLRKLKNFWMEKLNTDPLYFLTKETQRTVIPILEKLGRSFLKSDFEN